MRSVPFCYNIAIQDIRAMVVVIVVVAVVVVVIVVVIVVIVVVTDKGKRIHGVNCNTGAVEDIVFGLGWSALVDHIVFFSITAPFHALRKKFT